MHASQFFAERLRMGWMARHTALCEELRRLVGPAPGRMDQGLARAREILGDLQCAQSAYTREKARGVLVGFELWCSDRRWQRYCDGNPEHFRMRLLEAIAKLEATFRD